MCHFGKVLLFSNSIKGCPFCWFPFLFGVFDGPVFIFFCNYLHKIIFPKVVKLYLFTALPVVWGETSDKTWNKDSQKICFFKDF